MMDEAAYYGERDIYIYVYFLISGNAFPPPILCHFLPSTRVSDNRDQNWQAEFLINITILLKKRTGRDYREKGIG